MATYRTSVATGDTAGTGNRSAVLTPAVDDLWIVFCCVSVNTNSAPTCSDDNGGAYDLVNVAQWNAGANRLSAFVRTSLFPNTTSTTVTVATGSNTAGIVAIVAISGMSRAGISAIRQSGVLSDRSAATTPFATMTVGSALTGNLVLGAVANASNPAGMTPPASFTERQDVGQATPTTGLEVATRDSGHFSNTVTWGSTSATVNCAIAVELDTTAPEGPALGSLSMMGIGR